MTSTGHHSDRSDRTIRSEPFDQKYGLTVPRLSYLIHAVFSTSKVGFKQSAKREHSKVKVWLE